MIEPDHLHFDCTSGIAGDMFLGACLDLGMPREILDGVVRALGLEGVQLEVRQAVRGGIAGRRFRVLVDGRSIEGPDPEEAEGQGEATIRGEPAEGAPTAAAPHAGHSHGRSLAEITALIERSGLSAQVRQRSIEMFRRLGEVEARMHAVDLEEVHFHEVGAVDSLVDIVGAAAAMEWLAPASVSCGAVVLGSGSVRTEHGVLPVPSPAAAELLKGAPVRIASTGELVTPTGALILSTWVDEFVGRDSAVDFVPVTSGYGLGRRELADRPNALRLMRGRACVAPEEAPSETAAGDPPTVEVLECQLDDQTGEVLAHLGQKLLDAGALDVVMIPATMKKGRPGVLVQVLCRQAERAALARILLRESGSFGCRWTSAQRWELQRDICRVRVGEAEVEVKLGTIPAAAGEAERIVVAPEYESVRLASEALGLPLREVYEEARRGARKQRTDSQEGPAADASPSEVEESG